MAQDSNYIKLTHVRGKIDVSGMCQAACPHLGSKRDHTTPMGFPHLENRCFRHGKGQDRELQYQRVFCLSEQFEACEIYQEAARPIPERKPAAPHNARLRLGLPIGLIVMLLFGIIAVPIMLQDASKVKGLRLVPALDPVYALIQGAPSEGEHTDATPQVEDAGEDADFAAEAESLQDGPENDIQQGESEQDIGGMGSGNFRTVPYEYID